MKTHLLKSLSVLLLAVFAITGCKKEEEKPSKQYQAPSFASNTNVIEVPDKLLSSENTYAQMAAGYMMMANAFSGYAAYFNVPSNAVQSKTKSSETVWTWSYGSTTVKVTYSEDASYAYWVWYVNNVKFLDCKESKINTSGSFNVYDIEKGGALAVAYNWSLSASYVTATMKLIGNTSYFIKINAAVNGSNGTFDMYEGTSDAGFHFLNVTWLANGSGSWWIKTDDETYSGSWTN